MSKNNNLKENSSQNFILRGFNSIQVGLYILLGAYLLKSALQNFISDDNPMMMMSIEIIEVMGLSIAILVFLFSTLAIFFSSRRNARRSNFKVWNTKSKKHFWLYLLLFLTGIIVLKTIQGLGHILYLTPAFLFYLGTLLLILNAKKKKPYYLLALLSILLSILVFAIPTYWYSAILIMGVGFLVYGITVRK